MDNPHFADGCEPPWVVFPRLDPDELSQHLKQGVAEPWLDQKWRPFWSSLSEIQRLEYLDHWKASTKWRDAIQFFFGDTAGLDQGTDAAESERYLEEVRRQRPHRRSLIDRIFRRS
jgi:hypothetical protein